MQRSSSQPILFSEDLRCSSSRMADTDYTPRVNQTIVSYTNSELKRQWEYDTLIPFHKIAAHRPLQPSATNIIPEITSPQLSSTPKKPHLRKNNLHTTQTTPFLFLSSPEPTISRLKQKKMCHRIHFYHTCGCFHSTDIQPCRYEVANAARRIPGTNFMTRSTYLQNLTYCNSIATRENHTINLNCAACQRRRDDVMWRSGGWDGCCGVIWRAAGAIVLGRSWVRVVGIFKGNFWNREGWFGFRKRGGYLGMGAEFR
jgi:hypothetical protein